MKTFRQYCEDRDLYASLVPRELVDRRERLNKMVYAAYQRGDHAAAERLDAELEELEERIDSMLEDMDDGDAEEDRGEEERDVDRDWSVQDEFARIYDGYARGVLDLDDDELASVDPEEAKRNGWEARRAIDHNGKPIDRFYRRIPVSRERALANMLRGAVWESPYLAQHEPRTELIKNMPDRQIIDAARDAWERKRSLLGRIRAARRP